MPTEDVSLLGWDRSVYGIVQRFKIAGDATRLFVVDLPPRRFQLREFVANRGQRLQSKTMPSTRIEIAPTRSRQLEGMAPNPARGLGYCQGRVRGDSIGLGQSDSRDGKLSTAIRPRSDAWFNGSQSPVLAGSTQRWPERGRGRCGSQPMTVPRPRTRSDFDSVSPDQAVAKTRPCPDPLGRLERTPQRSCALRGEPSRDNRCQHLSNNCLTGCVVKRDIGQGRILARYSIC